MTNKQIPEGATHEGQGEVKFWVKDYVPGVGYKFSNQRRDGSFTTWVQATVGSSPKYPITPIKSEWRGPEDGLPPVGVVCEYNDNCGGRWVRVEVCYASQYTVLLKFFGEDGDCEGAFSPEEVRLRPIRTPEQIKAEQREKAVAEMLAQINCVPWETGHYRLAAEKWYDAGYRKFEIVDEQP